MRTLGHIHCYEGSAPMGVLMSHGLLGYFSMFSLYIKGSIAQQYDILASVCDLHLSDERLLLQPAYPLVMITNYLQDEMGW